MSSSVGFIWKPARIAWLWTSLSLRSLILLILYTRMIALKCFQHQALLTTGMHSLQLRHTILRSTVKRTILSGNAMECSRHRGRLSARTSIFALAISVSTSEIYSLICPKRETFTTFAELFDVMKIQKSISIILIPILTITFLTHSRRTLLKRTRQIKKEICELSKQNYQQSAICI